MSIAAATLATQLAPAAAQTGFGIYNAYQGNKNQKAGEMAKSEARSNIEDTQYADYNQSYYNELNRRANVGLPQEQMLAMQQGADRAAGVNLGVSEDRRGGLVGLGRSQTSLSDAYRNIAMADVSERNRNAEMMLGEMSNRGTSTYNEAQNLNMYDLSEAEKMRQEGLTQKQAGFQGIQGGVENAAPVVGNFMTSGGGAANLFGGGGMGAVAGAGVPSMATPPIAPTSGVNIAGQAPVTGLPANPYAAPTYGGGGFSAGQGMLAPMAPAGAFPSNLPTSPPPNTGMLPAGSIPSYLNGGAFTPSLGNPTPPSGYSGPVLFNSNIWHQ